MKKLYRKGQVHPSPSPSLSSSSSPSPSPSFDQFSLSYLPATIFTLTVSLSSQDKEVLAYLLSSFDFDFPGKSSKTHLNKSNNHNQPLPPSFSCYCFTCYTFYWALWDSSPNRQLIHEIIDAYEDNLVSQKKNKKNGLSRREKRKNNNNNNKTNTGVNHGDYGKINDEDVNGSNGLGRVNPELGRVDSVEGHLCDETGEKQGSNVRKIVSFIGERLWGSVWG